MLTEAELQKQWENLTFTDDFIFSRVMHDENICRQGRFLENSTTGVLRGGRGFAGARRASTHRDSLKSLCHSRLSGQKAVAPYLSSAGVLAASTQCAASSEGVVLGGARGKTSQPLGRF